MYIRYQKYEMAKGLYSPHSKLSWLDLNLVQKIAEKIEETKWEDFSVITYKDSQVVPPVVLRSFGLVRKVFELLPEEKDYETVEYTHTYYDLDDDEEVNVAMRVVANALDDIQAIIHYEDPMKFTTPDVKHWECVCYIDDYWFNYARDMPWSLIEKYCWGPSIEKYKIPYLIRLCD